MPKPTKETMRLNRVARAFTLASLLASKRSRIAAKKGNMPQAITMAGLAKGASVSANVAASTIKSPRYRTKTQNAINERLSLPRESWTTRWFKNP